MVVPPSSCSHCRTGCCSQCYRNPGADSCWGLRMSPSSYMWRLDEALVFLSLIYQDHSQHGRCVVVIVQFRHPRLGDGFLGEEDSAEPAARLASDDEEVIVE